MSAVIEQPPIAACSFCLKPNTEVRRLVAGPGVFICDECVALCAQLIDGPPASAPHLPAWEHAVSLDEVLSSLPRMAPGGARAEELGAGGARKAGARGATGARIGA